MYVMPVPWCVSVLTHSVSSHMACQLFESMSHPAGDVTPPPPELAAKAEETAAAASPAKPTQQAGTPVGDDSKKNSPQ